MESRVAELLEKYWDGETTLEEEKELKQILPAMEGYEAEKAFFLGISQVAEMEAERVQVPAPKKYWLQSWDKLAAMLLLFLVAGSVWYSYWQKLEERKAYEQVMQAFVLIQSNMQKGNSQLEAIEEFRYLNTPIQIFTQEK
jgi:hypothetical protein